MKLLGEADFRISMSRRANPFDNAQAESFFKTLKHEEVNLTHYRFPAERLAGAGGGGVSASTEG